MAHNGRGPRRARKGQHNHSQSPERANTTSGRGRNGRGPRGGSEIEEEGPPTEEGETTNKGGRTEVRRDETKRDRSADVGHVSAQPSNRFTNMNKAEDKQTHPHIRLCLPASPASRSWHPSPPAPSFTSFSFSLVFPSAPCRHKSTACISVGRRKAPSKNWHAKREERRDGGAGYAKGSWRRAGSQEIVLRLFSVCPSSLRESAMSHTIPPIRPHARKKAFARYVPWFRFVLFSVHRSFPRKMHVPHPWEAQEGLDDLTAHFLFLLPSLWIASGAHSLFCANAAICSWCGCRDREGSTQKKRGHGA